MYTLTCLIYYRFGIGLPTILLFVCQLWLLNRKVLFLLFVLHVRVVTFTSCSKHWQQLIYLNILFSFMYIHCCWCLQEIFYIYLHDTKYSYQIQIICKNRDIGPAVRVFANGPGDLGSIPGRVIPKTLKMVLDTTLLNTQHYKVRFKGKVEQSWEWSSALPYTLV